jgi:ferredoxin--NADP+ reductase
MRLEDYPKDPRFDATVLKSEPIVPEDADVEIRELVLEVDRPEFHFDVGQSIGVLVEGPKEFGASVHHRLYTVADTPSADSESKPEVTIVVKRCNYIDDYSGEEYEGVSSNYLCDRRPGDKLSITGPYGLAFKVPENKNANLLLIGLGTGIAPFRAFLKHIYKEVGDWKGKVRLLHGARSGLELLYMNDKRDDFALYYDEETFESIQALSPRPNWADPIAWDFAIEDRGDEILSMLEKEDTYVYVAGLVPIRDQLDKVFAAMIGPPKSWSKKKAELQEAGRWVELLY